MGRKRLYLTGLLVVVLVAGMVFALFHEEIHEKYFLSEEEKLRREAAAFFACKPEKPLSREELFARAMQNYWRRDMEALWRVDKAIGDDMFPRIKTDFTDRTCGLVRDKRGNPLTISRDTCYPWKITEYDTLEKLRARIQEAPDLLMEREEEINPDRRYNTYDIIVREILRGQVIHPETELPYSPEDLQDGRADFAIIHHGGAWIFWSEPDCCRLVTYDELPENRKSNPSFWISPYLRYLPPDTRMEDVMFLAVTTYVIDNTWPNARDGTFYLDRGKLDESRPINMYSVISPCGAIH